MTQCPKCGREDISVTYYKPGTKVGFNTVESTHNFNLYTRNEPGFIQDKVITECLVYTCNSCLYPQAEPPKDA